MDVLQNELNQSAEMWNLHNITARKLSEGPSGKPDIMFAMPELYGSRSYHTEINVDEIQELRELHGTPRQPEKCKSDFSELFELLIPGLVQPLVSKIRDTLY